ncbi:MAG: hypothetical protein KJ067_23005 [Vicinamibacteria bacterium]|nr:hypothetical protein [Vicinamibacteria bacterium]
MAAGAAPPRPAAVFGWLLAELRQHHAAAAVQSLAMGGLAVAAQTAALTLLARALRGLEPGAVPGLGLLTAGALLLLMLAGGGLSWAAAWRSSDLAADYLERCGRRALERARPRAREAPRAAARAVGPDVAASGQVACIALGVVPPLVTVAAGLVLMAWLHAVATTLGLLVALPFLFALQRQARGASAIAREIHGLRLRGRRSPRAGGEGQADAAPWAVQRLAIGSRRLEDRGRLTADAFTAVALAGALALIATGGSGQLGTLAAFLVVLRSTLGAVQALHAAAVRLAGLWPALARHHELAVHGRLTVPEGVDAGDDEAESEED